MSISWVICLMEISENIKKVVYAYDLSCLGIPVKVPETLGSADKLNPQNLKNFCPSFLERTSLTAWDFCYLTFRRSNPNGTIEEFRKNFYGTPAGHAAYKVALDEVSKILPEVITAEALVEFLHKAKREN